MIKISLRRTPTRQDGTLVDAHGSFHPEPGCVGGAARLVEMAAEVLFFLCISLRPRVE